jgi:CRISPR-associated protein (TIGR02710 family)
MNIETADVERLIIYTVGGSPEPIVASLKHHQPRRVVFVPSPQTRTEIAGKILPLLRSEGLAEPAYDIKVVPDAQDFELCVKTLRDLEPLVREWGIGSERKQAAIDLTGGTKLMSAALALVARTWPCEFLYVGGKERTKQGIGVVVSGTEQMVHSVNPWDGLGYQAIEQATLLFDHGNFTAAATVLEDARDRAASPSAKRVLQTMKDLADAYEAWDLFDHKKTDACFANVLKNITDLGSALPEQQHRLEGQIKKHRQFLSQLDPKAPDAHFIADLIANACRRAKQGRFDDAVARLYRAIEVAAQVQLRNHGFSSTSRIPLANVPEPLRTCWCAKAENGNIQLGLQDDYKLLGALRDPLQQRFAAENLSQKSSPLTARNNSILAHGFDPVKKDAFQKLLSSTIALVALDSDSLPEFPSLRGYRI